MALPRKLNIAIVDDHAWMRDGLRVNLESWPHGRVVLEAADGLDYERKCASAPPIDIALVDVVMPNRDGIETTKWIVVNQPDTLILAITFLPTDDVVHQLLLAGVHGILPKKDDRTELFTALDHLRATRRYHNELVHRQLTHVPDPGSPMALRRKAVESLAPRELEFLLIYVGTDLPTIKECARRMKIERNTAEWYRKALVEKTGERSRTGLYKFALRFGLLKN